MEEQLQAIQDFLANLQAILSVLLVMVGAYLLLLWAASVLWVYRDIRMRSEDISVQVLAVGLALFLPFLGIPLHLILRPRYTITERYERSLEEEYLRRDVEEKFVCPSCQRPIEPDFVLCPHCHTNLRRQCAACHRVVDLTWAICPYCGYDGADHGSVNVTTLPPARYPHQAGSNDTAVLAMKDDSN
ncbi:MAG: zinc ribbon domain-containing protein [Chloroflexaceae bacterium]|nr:zinc ribbon domain-containing protein [Chloroflexaceae bacterium]